MVKKTLLLLLLIFSVLGIFCNMEPLPFSEPDGLSLSPSILWKKGDISVTPDEVDSIRFKIIPLGEKNPDTIKAVFLFQAHEGTITVPDVPRLRVIIEGLDASGTVVFKGSVTVDNNKSGNLEFIIEAHQVTPLKPSDVTITQIANTCLRVTWTDNSSNEDGFIILRGTDPDDITFLDSVPKNSISYVDSSVEPEVNYYYAVVSYNGAGKSNQHEPEQGLLIEKTIFFLQSSSVLSQSVYIGELYREKLLVEVLEEKPYSIEVCSLLSQEEDSIWWTPVDSNTGENLLWATISDSSKVIDSVWWTITVIDTIKPELSIRGLATIHLSLNDTYDEPGAEAFDNADGDLTDSIKISGEVRTDSIGEYVLIYSVSDRSGNKAPEKTRIVLVSSGEEPPPPEIILKGKTIDTVEVGQSYNDLGASAWDKDKDISNKIMVFDSVNTSRPGVYKIIYRVSNSTGDETEKVRSVYVLDRTPPEIILTDDDTLYHEVGTPFIDPGFEVTDNYDEIQAESVTVSGEVDSEHPGTYRLFYNVQDSSGNSAEEQCRIVIVRDTEPPVVTLVGGDTLYVKVFTSFKDSGVHVSDNYDSDVTVDLVGEDLVDTSKLGTYLLSYSATDSSGNRSEEIPRVIIVIDDTPPEITILGSDTVRIFVNGVFRDSGATAFDNYYGDLTDQIVRDGQVDTSVEGTYQLRYTVTDSSNNTSEAERIVIVIRPLECQYCFPQSQPPPYGIVASGVAPASIQQFFETWKSEYYTEWGDLARITRTAGSNTTTSRDIGHGMLIMVYMDNLENGLQDEFDRLWNFYQASLNENGLMYQYIEYVENGTIKTSALPDADSDVALALLMAYRQWGDSKYLLDAQALIQKIWNFEVTDNFQIRSDDDQDLSISPSFFNIAALQLFSTTTTGSDWDMVIANSYNLLNASRNTSTGLVPNWCDENGTPVIGTGADIRFGNEASRVPWRLAMAFSWFGHTEAGDLAGAMASHFVYDRDDVPGSIVNGYSLDGTTLGTEVRGSFVGALTCAGMVNSVFEDWVNEGTTWLLSQITNTDPTVELLYLLLLSGNMPNFYEP